MTLPAFAVRLTLAVPASTDPGPVRLPVTRLIAIAPLLVEIAPALTTRSRACSMVTASPFPVTLTDNSATLVTIDDVCCALTVARLAVISPVTTTPPRVASMATSPAPALMSPGPVRLPFSIVNATSPSFVTTLPASITRSFTSVIVKVSALAVMLATRLATLVFTLELF